MTTYSAKAFDTVAMDYDHDFTHSKTGTIQRQQVHRYLKSLLIEGQLAETVLEVNAGTGEDAVFLAQYCKDLRLTDVSEKMLEVSRTKCAETKNIQTQQLDAKDLGTISESFDLIFSNFAGLNCLNPDEIKAFMQQAQNKLNDKGDLILILLSSASWWEKFWGFIANNKKLRIRRQEKTGVSTKINNQMFMTYYYAPKTIAAFAPLDFEVIKVMPIGLFIPPTFLEPRVKTKGRLLKRLEKLEQTFATWSLLSNYADHYLIHLKKK